MARQPYILLAMGAAAVAIFLRPLTILYGDIPAVLSAFAFGAAILGAAFLMAWTAEATQAHVRSTLIVVFVALIAVLPEYAVDMVFTVKAASNLTGYGSYPLANMTGANRLLIGIGWPLVVFISWIRTKKSTVILQKRNTVELLFLLFASLYAFVIWWKEKLELFDGAVLGGLFLLYFWVSSRIATEIPEPHRGPARAILLVAREKGKWILGALFFFAALAIGFAAEPFSESLLKTGEAFGIEKFLLVQWLAPFASEFPEITISALFAASALGTYGFHILLSSKINHWTLLVGMVPVIFVAANLVLQGSAEGLPLDARQREELFITASQSVFALAILSNLRLAWYEALALCALFLLSLHFRSPEMRMLFSYLYLGLTGVMLAVFLVADRKRILALFAEARNAVKRGYKA